MQNFVNRAIFGAQYNSSWKLAYCIHQIVERTVLHLGSGFRLKNPGGIGVSPFCRCHGFLPPARNAQLSGNLPRIQGQWRHLELGPSSRLPAPANNPKSVCWDLLEAAMACQ